MEQTGTQSDLKFQLTMISDGEFNLEQWKFN